MEEVGYIVTERGMVGLSQATGDELDCVERYAATALAECLSPTLVQAPSEPFASHHRAVIGAIDRERMRRQISSAS